MGVEYYAVNKANKTFYELGKGGWYSLNDIKDAFNDVEYLALCIKDDCFHLLDEDTHYTKEEIKKFEERIDTRIAPELFEAMKGAGPNEIEIINDCGDELWIIRSKGYRAVGTRFGEHGTKEYEENLDFLNRHFNAPPHRYDPEEAAKYDKFEKF